MFNARGPERIDTLKERFREGQFSENVFRASLFAIGLRGDDIASIVYEEKERIHDKMAAVHRLRR